MSEVWSGRDAPTAETNGDTERRRRAVGVFAMADAALLAPFWERIGVGFQARTVRGPEVGLVMLRGRIGGGGAAFNLGEASVTRATVRLDGGEIGHAMILGRDLDKARLAACLDAAWQEGTHRVEIEAEIVAPALAERTQDDTRRAEETQATRVDFFTVVRGEDR